MPPQRELTVGVTLTVGAVVQLLGWGYVGGDRVCLCVCARVRGFNIHEQIEDKLRVLEENNETALNHQRIAIASLERELAHTLESGKFKIHKKKIMI